MLNNETLKLGSQLQEQVLTPLKQLFVSKDEVIDLLGLCLVARENLFIFGPPGTAKSAIVQRLASMIDGQTFDYLLTRFTEPNEVFGPFDIRKLRDGQLQTNTEGMLPEADFVFLDELLNANSAILNSLLLVLNERVFRRGRETRSLPTLMVVGASNNLPEDEALGALFDRFLMRVRCDNVPGGSLEEVLLAGWQLEQQTSSTGRFSVEDVKQLQSALSEVDLSAVISAFATLINRLRDAGISVSDRRAVKLQRMVAASAMMAGRSIANPSDFWVLRYIWDVDEERDLLATLVDQALDTISDADRRTAHPRSVQNVAPDPEQLAHDLAAIGEQLRAADNSDSQKSVLKDRLSLVVTRCQWVTDEQQRVHLQKTADALWSDLGMNP